MGPARYCMLQAALELARRHYREALRAGPALAPPRPRAAFLLAQLRDRPYEVFCCLHLDNRHRLIAFEELFRGTIDGASVHPREVLRQALARNAAAVIFAHNHPSGVAEPSQADELITRRLREALGAGGHPGAGSLHRRRRPLHVLLRSGASLICGATSPSQPLGRGLVTFAHHLCGAAQVLEMVPRAQAWQYREIMASIAENGASARSTAPCPNAPADSRVTRKNTCGTT